MENFPLLHVAIFGCWYEYVYLCACHTFLYHSEYMEDFIDSTYKDYVCLGDFKRTLPHQQNKTMGMSGMEMVVNEAKSQL